jgi:ABC-type sugar transport system ATPase subunit
MLSISGVSKSFGGNKVVDNVSFTVAPGEIHALLGANGAGKSTLINILGGRFRDAEGTVSLNGTPLKLHSPSASLQSGIGIVHQEFDLIPALSVSENMFLGRERDRQDVALFRRIDRRRLQAAATDLLAAYALSLDVTATVESLPIASRQLTQIARALALQSEVVIFDEPTARLGPVERQLLFAIFAKLKAAGKQLIFVTHYLDEVIEVADRATVMRDGKFVATVHTATTGVAELSRLMVGEDVAKLHKTEEHSARGTVFDLKDHRDDGFEPINLHVGKGEVLGIVGHLGSGRHELTRSIVRTLRKNKAKDAIVVGFLPEDRRSEGIFPQLSVGDNISLGELLRRSPFQTRPRAEERAVADDVIAKLRIRTQGRAQRISELSGGNQQKAVFGRAMVQKPQLYVVECPTVGVDVRAAADLHAQMLRLVDDGAGVVLATDDIDEVLTLSDRILVMFRGRVVAEYSHGTVSRHELITAMGSA